MDCEVTMELTPGGPGARRFGTGGDPAELISAVLAVAPVIDGHNDLPWALRATSGYSVSGLDDGRPDLQTDLPRLRAGGVGAQFWSVFVPSSLTEPEAVVATLEQVDAVYRLVARYPDDLVMAVTAADVERAIGAGRIASLLGIEGGHSIATSLGVLRAFARLGVRYLTLTHNDSTSWADSATGTGRAGGLDEVGRAVVAELNRIGILVDLSHVADSTMHAALDVTTAPVIFSHSSTRALCPHPRNVPDDVLSRLAGNGGVVQITFVPQFVSVQVYDWSERARAEKARLSEHLGLPPRTDRVPAPQPGESPQALRLRLAGTGETDSTIELRRAGDQGFADWLDLHPRPEVSLGQVADHVEHAREVAGVEHIGLGGDFDGVDVQPADLADVSGYPRLLAELARRHWSGTELAALTGRNVLRVLRSAEDAATEPLWPSPAQHGFRTS